MDNIVQDRDYHIFITIPPKGNYKEWAKLETSTRARTKIPPWLAELEYEMEAHDVELEADIKFHFARSWKLHDITININF